MLGVTHHLMQPGVPWTMAGHRGKEVLAWLAG